MSRDFSRISWPLMLISPGLRSTDLPDVVVTMVLLKQIIILLMRENWPRECGNTSMMCGIPRKNSLNIRAKFMAWWLIKPQNQVREIILQYLPSFISWEIWKFRCSYQYDGIRSTTNRVIDEITMLIQRTLAAQFTTINFSPPFSNIFHVVERIRPQLSIIPVSWKCPDIGKYKLNIDG